MDHISIELALGIVVAIVIPTVLFTWRMHWFAKENYKMHCRPDDYSFGTTKTNELLDQHMKDETEMHMESISVIKDLRHAIRELSHYTRWSAKERIGKEPPPYVRDKA